jgi:hypothetical protein
MYGNVEVWEHVIHVYRLKNENIQIRNKMKVRSSAKRVTSDIANSVKNTQ